MGARTSLLQRVWAVAALGSTLASLPQVAANAVTIHFSSIISGANQVPPTSSSAMGTATGTLSGDSGSFVFSYMINYSGLSGPVTKGHFHNAPIGSNGPGVHDLDSFEPSPIIENWRFDDAIDPLTDTLAQELINNNIYISFHTATFPKGEIRGQFIADPRSVPEPSFGLSLFGLGTWGIVSQLKNQKNKQKLADQDSRTKG
jgi:hypothetical protein